MRKWIYIYYARKELVDGGTGATPSAVGSKHGTEDPTSSKLPPAHPYLLGPQKCEHERLQQCHTVAV
eukprot:518495-Pelagomonas_calceolata.AAC.4